MTIWDLPLFILNELSSGPYGPEVTAKIARIERWYEMYLEGADFETDEQPDDDYHPTVLKSKKIHRLIDKEAEFMVGKTPAVLVSVDGEDIDSDHTAEMQAYLDKVLSKNNFAAKIIRGVRDCLIGGRVFLKVNVLPNEGIRLMFVPADSFVYETAPDDVDTLTKVILFYNVVTTDDKRDQRWWRQIYWKEKDGHVFFREDLYDGYGNKIEGYGTDATDTGLSRIPGCVIINDGLSGDFDGESDVEMIAAEDSEYNKSRSENQDTLSKNMNPMAYIIGANPKTFRGLDRRPGAVNDIQPDPVLGGTLPQVGQLENSFGFSSAYQSNLTDLKAEMYDAIGMPDLTLAATSGLVTSGKGLKALYWPLICRCDGKWATWKPALEQMAELIIDAAAVYPELKSQYGDFDSNLAYTVTIEPQYALPDDEEEERKLDMQEVQSGSRSIKSYLMKWGGNDAEGLTAEQADAEIEQIAAEKRMMEAAYEDMSEIDEEE